MGPVSGGSVFLCLVKSGTEENLPRCQGGGATSLQKDLLLPDELLIPELAADWE